MERIRVPLEGRSYDVLIGRSVLGEAAAFVSGRKLFVVTDENVERLYGGAFCRAFGRVPKKVIAPGEASKCFSVLEEVLEAMLAAGLNRNSCVVAFGGGVVGDLAGFAAAVYMRGIRYIQIPTTLLAEVDSSVGGKTAIDVNRVKNIVGAFHQPDAVFIGTEFLETLPPREIACGWGEIVKTAFLDEGLYAALTQEKAPEAADVIPMCVKSKRDVVALDEREGGARKRLNLGHTFGHALETIDGRLSHGEYVLKGLELEFRLAGFRGVCGEAYAFAADALIRNYTREDVALPAFQTLFNVLSADKKNTDVGVSFLLPVRPGTVREELLNEGEIETFWRTVQGCG